MSHLSLQQKILGIVLSALALIAICTIGLTSYQLGNLVDLVHDDLAAQKVEAAVSYLKKTDKGFKEKLESLGLSGADVTALLQQKQQEVVASLRKEYYAKDDQAGFLMIVDADGKTILHPKLKTGDPTTDLGFTKQSLALKNGEFDYDLVHEKWWVVTRTFDDWKWAVSYTVPVKDKYKSVQSIQAIVAALIRNLEIVIGLITVFSGAVIFIIMRRIGRAMQMLIAHLKDISEGEGDLTKRLHVASHDEIGEIAKHFNRFLEKLQGIISRIADNANVVASSATALSQVSTQTVENVHTLSGRAVTAAAAAAESSTNSNSVAANMAQTSSSLSSVSAVTEEMSSTIADISTNPVRARSLGEKAVMQSQSIRGLMGELSVATKEIGKIMESITRISSQTNLLALNATIEAATAGDAGRGFAVVANEVKVLARQTADATQDIDSRIGIVQMRTQDSVDKIDEITGVIAEFGDIVSRIAVAIEEQASGTKDVARNISQATEGVGDTSGRAAQAASAAKSIASDINSINDAIGGVRHGGEQVRVSAEDLANLAHQLKGLVGQFKVA